MSHYTKLAPKILKKNEKELVSALSETFGKSSVEVHENRAPIRDYTGADSNRPHCHIIVRQDAIQAANGRGIGNDTGLLRQKDGEGYDMFVDKSIWSDVINGKVMQSYNLAVAEKSAKAQGYTTKRIPLPDGGIRLEMSQYS